MRITKVKIFPKKPGSSIDGAEAEVELDGVLALRGIWIRRSRFGNFLTFPSYGARSFVDLLEPAFAKTLRHSVMNAYAGHPA